MLLKLSISLHTSDINCICTNNQNSLLAIGILTISSDSELICLCDAAEGAHLLGCLIHSAPRLVMPYVVPILKALVSKLKSASMPLIILPSPQGGPPLNKGGVQGGGETGVMASVLATTGELARVAGPILRPHIGDILPLIIDAIGHPSGANKSVVAVVTLGQVSKQVCAYCV